MPLRETGPALQGNTLPFSATAAQIARLDPLNYVYLRIFGSYLEDYIDSQEHPGSMRDSKRRPLGASSPLPQPQPLAQKAQARRFDMTVCLDVARCPPGAQPESLQLTPRLDQQHANAGVTPAAFARRQNPDANDMLILPEDDGTRVMTRTRRKSLRILNADQDTDFFPESTTENNPPANGETAVCRYDLPWHRIRPLFWM